MSITSEAEFHVCKQSKQKTGYKEVLTTEQAYKEGCRFYAIHRYKEAAEFFRDCLERQPGDPVALNALGSALEALGSLDEASIYLGQACQLQPKSAPFRFNHANLLRRCGDKPGAEHAYLEAIQLDSDLAEAYHGLGSLYLEEGKLESAEACLLKATGLKTNFVLALHDLGQLRQQQGVPDEAETLYRLCTASEVGFLPALNSLGTLLMRKGLVEEARNCFEKALKTDHGYLQARCNLAVLDTWCGNLDTAISSFRQATINAPHDGNIHFNLALALLAVGRFEEGWREFEWRFSKSNPVPLRYTETPRWHGELLVGKSILIHAEQGYGDSLQFIRFASILASRGATVLVEGQDRVITPLLATAQGVAAAFSRGDELPFKPDFQIPMMSLPLELGVDGAHPPIVKYLHPPEERISFWRDTLSELPGYKVGVAWAGRPEQENDANRSISPEHLAPLCELQGISWVSLQFGPHKLSSPSLPLFDFAGKVADFCDSAALVAGLDLVITVNSAVAHLAGALGKPVFLLHHWNTDWRWMHDSMGSPWYPETRIIRQSSGTTWEDVIGAVMTDLPNFLQNYVVQSPLSQTIHPEIHNDEFYHLLRDLTAREPIITALEIGSSSGEDSTAALVEGLSRNRTRPMLFCLEASRSRYCQLSERYAQTPFVRCLNASSVAGESGVEQGGITAIKNSYSIERFDLVLINGSEFTGEAELDELIGARWIALDDVNAYKNFHNYQRLSMDPDYTLIAENWQLRNGYALFRHREALLPVHFFTIVLNGMPFISHHIDAFRHLPFRWHWHIVEGAADLVADTGWSLPNGGHMPGNFHHDGLSIDGTSEYIDQLKRLFPDNITLYRMPAGQLWQGKLAMVNAPLNSIQEECLLWEIDADECWSHAQLCTGWRMFHDEPWRSAAFYWCHFFVGPQLVVSSRNCYGQVAGQEWLRTWRYSPGCRWVAHEPPRLISPEPDGGYDIARQTPYTNDETEAKGLVFQHFAYITADQVRFKEKYYGYRQATYHWMQLQKEINFPVRLGDYLPWVPDGTTVDTVASQGFIPLPILANRSRERHLPEGPIVIDGVFFQYHVTGVARVWLALLEELNGTRFSSKVVILDRGKTTPRIEGYHYLDIPHHNESDIPGEREMLQRYCDKLSATLFMSTWHTCPLETPSLLMIHDLLPEILLGEQRLEAGSWQEKKLAIEHARAFIAVSENSAIDLVRWYPEAGKRSINIMHNGVSSDFRPATPERIRQFKNKHGITLPYFLFVGPREWYKNFRLLLEAFLLLPEPHAYCIVSPHGEKLEEEFAGHPGSAFVHLTGRLSDEDLVAAYSGAVALVYPSLYEGFGLPPLEAMACGCPVITSTAPAMLEVCGEAAIYVKPDDCDALASAMASLSGQSRVDGNVRRGLERAAVFSWQHSVSQLLRAVCSQLGGKPGLDNIILERKLPI